MKRNRLEYQQAWRAANPHRVRNHIQRYYRKHRMERIAATKAYMKQHPDKAALWGWRTRLRLRYNMEPEQYEVLLARQNGCCAICDTVPWGGLLAVDHN